MLFVTTASETDALLLESNLIKRLKPRYNVSFRDDKSFPNILLRQDHAFPQLLKHRGAKTSKGVYFGPFASAGAVNRTLNTLQRAFLLRSCSDSVFDSRTRPCLLFQIKRCSAPCVNRIDATGYQELVEEAENFLSGKSQAVQNQLKAEMTRRPRQWISARRPPARPPQGHEPYPVHRASIRPPSRKPTCSRPIAKADTPASRSSLPRRTELGQPPLFPRHDRDLPSRRSAGSFVRPALRRTHRAQTDPDLGRRAGALLAEALAPAPATRSRSPCPSAAKTRDHGTRLTNAREQLGRRLAENSAQTQLLEGVADLFGLTSRRAASRSTTTHIQGAHTLGASSSPGPKA
jgi:excinuclease ABC subunit C